MERRSSIGAIVAASSRLASSRLATSGSRTTVGATLPKAIRERARRTAAITTFEIACAARVPTFRYHGLPSTGGISIDVINSSGRITLFL